MSSSSSSYDVLSSSWLSDHREERSANQGDPGEQRRRRQSFFNLCSAVFGSVCSGNSHCNGHDHDHDSYAITGERSAGEGGVSFARDLWGCCKHWGEHCHQHQVLVLFSATYLLHLPLSVGQSVIDSFRLEIYLSIPSPSFASLLTFTLSLLLARLCRDKLIR